MKEQKKIFCLITRNKKNSLKFPARLARLVCILESVWGSNLTSIIYGIQANSVLQIPHKAVWIKNIKSK